jgi:branched-chain amino acid transport system ATP-binding protein
LVLDLDAIHVYYGDSHVLHGVSLGLGEGRLLGLLGRNGAGKTTSCAAVVGVVPPRAGEVRLFGERVSGLAPEAIAARGLALVPQGRRIFKSLTVRENLLVASRQGKGKAQAALREVFAMFPRLGERESQIAGLLSGGEQQMLAIGRALMARPRVLLMDEPSEGLAPLLVAEVMTAVRRLKAQGLSILLVEQNARLVQDVADDLVILNSGRVVVAGPTAELQKSGVDFAHHLGVF